MPPSKKKSSTFVREVSIVASLCGGKGGAERFLAAQYSCAQVPPSSPPATHERKILLFKIKWEI